MFKFLPFNISINNSPFQIDDIFKEDYTPSIKDILRTRIITTGIREINFDLKCVIRSSNVKPEFKLVCHVLNLIFCYLRGGRNVENPKVEGSECRKFF
jgi:hypothetical protein